MGTEFTFFDYVDDRGTNVVTAWFTQQSRSGAKVKAKFDTRLLTMEATPAGEGYWLRPQTETLHGDCEGLFEIRALLRNVQLRLLGFHHASGTEVTLVFGATERDGKWEPLSACAQALKRRIEAITHPALHRTRHFS